MDDDSHSTTPPEDTSPSPTSTSTSSSPSTITTTSHHLSNEATTSSSSSSSATWQTTTDAQEEHMPRELVELMLTAMSGNNTSFFYFWQQVYMREKGQLVDLYESYERTLQQGSLSPSSTSTSNATEPPAASDNVILSTTKEEVDALLDARVDAEDDHPQLQDTEQQPQDNTDTGKHDETTEEAIESDINLNWDKLQQAAFDPKLIYKHVHLWFKASINLLMPVLDMLPVDQDTAVLDVGCGNGHLCQYLLTLGFEHVTGSDYSPAAVEVAQIIQEAWRSGMDDATRSKRPQASFVVDDILNTTLNDNAYGLIVDKGTLDTIGMMVQKEGAGDSTIQDSSSSSSSSTDNDDDDDDDDDRTLTDVYAGNIYATLAPGGLYVLISACFEPDELASLFLDYGMDLLYMDRQQIVSEDDVLDIQLAVWQRSTE